MRWAAEDGFRECGEGDFLGEEGAVGGEFFGFGKVRFEGVVACEVPTVEGEKEIAEPGVRGGDQAVENGVQEEFSEVVDAVADQRRDAEVIST